MNESDRHEPRQIRIFLVDDHPVTLSGLRTVLNGPPFEIVGEALTGRDAVAGILSNEVDVVILDVQLPDMNGLEVLKRVKAATPAVAVILYTAFPEPEYLMGGVLGGAAGFLLKERSASEIRDTILRVTDGEEALPRCYWEPLLKELQIKRLGKADRSAEGWPEREIAILQCMARGLANHRIAEALHMHPDTVRFHIRKIFKRLDVSDRTQAVVKAIGRGLISAVP